jgi:peptidyl-prolyl cis-trans isomerase SurA
MNWKRFVLALLAAAAFVLPIRAAGTELLNGVAAIVNESVITFDDVNLFTRRAIKGLENQLLPRGKTAEFDQRRQTVLRDGLEQLIERDLIIHEFKTAGYNLPESIIDDVVSARVKEEFGDRLTLTKTLHERNQTFESFRKDERDAFVVSQMTIKNINQNLVISPKKIERFFSENQEKYRVGDRAKVRMILIDKSRHAVGEPKKIADEVLAKAKAGADFGKLADESSDDARRFKGGLRGDQGWVENKDSDLRKELRDFAFNANIGDLSPVIETDGAIFLLKVEAREQARVRPLTEVRDDVEATLKGVERERLRKKWINKLRSKAFVRYF